MIWASIAVAAVIATAVAITLLLRARKHLRTLEASSGRERADAAAHAERAERQRGAFLQILNGFGEGVLAVDRERRVVLANSRFREIFGVEDLSEGRPVSEIARVTAVLAGLEKALLGEEAAMTFSVGLGAGERLIEVRAFPLKEGEIAAVATFIDVTRLQRLEKIRRDFISDFSHEVRTPMAGLRSAVETYELSREKITDEEDRQLRRIMTRQLARLERLVDDLSELSRIESGEVSLDRRPVDLRKLIEDLCEDFVERAAQKNLRFDITGAGTIVSADALRIQQAFSNLLDNAIQYGGNGASIDIDIGDEGGAALVRITDHGEGIPLDEQERIFRRFYRVDRSRAQNPTGSGLGLAITRHIFLQHQGDVRVESTPGRGATFVVRLPK